jgi:hypothetical protein
MYKWIGLALGAGLAFVFYGVEGSEYTGLFCLATAPQYGGHYPITCNKVMSSIIIAIVFASIIGLVLGSIADRLTNKK